MNCKKSQHFGDDASLDIDPLNPFTHRLELSTTYEKIKTAILTVLILPFRVAAICGLLILAWWIASIGLYGLSEKELRTKPMTGWRKKLREIISAVGQLTYRVGGMSIVVKGRQATRQEAPILVIAPHSTFLDAVIVYVAGFPSIIARWESGLNPWLGKLINYTQPVYVWRDDHDSRQNTIKEIIERANSELDWPQVLIFPEGTCTNRSCLITFKSGAFYPGVPVQPVCIRYPNKLDTVTWTWEGPGALKLLWLTLTQIHSSCEIEFLPVYKPSKEEKNDPKLFANNVRKLMAEALGVPISNYTYDDCRLMNRAKQMRLPCAGKLVELQKLRQALGLSKSNVEENIICRNDFRYIMKSPAMSFKTFTNILNISPENPLSFQLFKLCDKNCIEEIDFKDYLLAVLVITKSGNLSELIYLVFKVIDKEGNGNIKKSDFCTTIHRILSIDYENCSSMFHAIDKNSRGYITYNEFKEFALRKKKLSYVFKPDNCNKNKYE